MPAKNRIKVYVEDSYYHIYNRGVEKRGIFLDDQDYGIFLSYLKTYLTPKNKKEIDDKLTNPDLDYRAREKLQRQLHLNNFSDTVELLAYCLMPNHFHFLIYQKEAEAIKEFMNSLGTRYSMYFNRKYDRVGPLFQDRYRAVLVGTDPQLLHLSRYIHLQALASQGRALRGRQAQPSSFPNYLGKISQGWVKPDKILTFFRRGKSTYAGDRHSYQAFVEDYNEATPKLISDLTIEEYESARPGLAEKEAPKPELVEPVPSQGRALRGWAYFALEVGLPELGLRYAGGLGILAGDTYLLAQKAKMPFAAVTLFYPIDWRQEFDRSFYLYEVWLEPDSPRNYAWKKVRNITVRANDTDIQLELYRSGDNNTAVYALYEPGLRGLYAGDSSGEHRLYQEIVLGFGGWEALASQGRALRGQLQLNEASTVFAALAELDALCKEGATLKKAKQELAKRTVFTSHTLVGFAGGVYTEDQYRRYVLQNIQSQAMREWLLELVKKQDGRLAVRTLAMELAGIRTGVSKLHAQKASQEYKKADGRGAQFAAVTNGISLERWLARKLFALYKAEKVVDRGEKPGKNYKKAISSLTTGKLRKIKDESRKELVTYLAQERVDQYGQAVQLPVKSSLICWARRFAGYKRPRLLFEDLGELEKILSKTDAHLIIAGEIHPGDQQMKLDIQRILQVVDKSAKLQERVHFIQAYDAELAKKLVTGVDIWLNTPRVGHEACGTSWMKAVANLGVLISTADGGVAEVRSTSYLKISDSADKQAVARSLYGNISKGLEICGDESKWGAFVRKQLSTYLPVISGGRMLSDYQALVSF